MWAGLPQASSWVRAGKGAGWPCRFSLFTGGGGRVRSAFVAKAMRELAGEENGIEGNNIYSDCWAQEHMTHTSYAEPRQTSFPVPVVILYLEAVHTPTKDIMQQIKIHYNSYYASPLKR